LYKGGIVIVQEKTHYVLHVADGYIGVIMLNLQTGDCSLGFVGSINDDYNIHSISQYDDSFLVNGAILKMFPFVLVTEQRISSTTGNELSTGNVSVTLNRFDITKQIIDSVQTMYMLVSHSFEIVRSGVKIAYDGIVFVPTATLKAGLAVYTGATTGIKYVFDVAGQVVETTVSTIKLVLYGAIGVGIVFAASQIENKRRRIQ
jgi:hypothetical protein